MPKRIQRKRSKGWRMPENAVYVGRPSLWGNPFSVGLARCGCRSAGECDHNLFRTETALEAIALYRNWITSGGFRKHRLTELRGKDLACWCPEGAPCHADVLLELANQ